MFRMKATVREPEFIVRKGKPVAIVLPLRVYHGMLEQLEDFEDVCRLLRAKAKPQAFRPLADYLAERRVSRP